MREERESRAPLAHPPSLPSWLHPSTSPSPSILLPAIKDQQIYLAITSTFLTLAREAGAPLHPLRQVAHALLAARGFEEPLMLGLGNGGEGEEGEGYGWWQRGCAGGEMRSLLERMEKEMLSARQKEKQYRCLQRYRKVKEEEIAPSFGCAANTRKERFKRTVKGKYCKRSLQSSNFYQFDVNQILQNSFKAENECYKTVGSFVHLKTMYGHAADQDIESYSPTYNAIFDRSENFIITSGEEGLIKVWHKGTGTLIRNLKGHTDFLNKIDTSKCNKYLLSCGGDGVRFFDLRSFAPLGGWKASSIDEITSFVDEDGRSVFLFGENSELFLLEEEVMLASANRRLQLKDFMIFSFKEIIGKDNAAILVISLSPQKTHLLIGLETGQFLMVGMGALQEIMRTGARGQTLVLPSLQPIKAHHQDIIEIKWGDSNSQWATGSKDGRCCLWEMKGDQITLINTLAVNRGQRGKKKRNFICTYICWNCTFSHFAAGFQENVNEEDTERGQGEVLVYSLRERRVTCELSRDISLPVGGIRAMDSHPQYPNILLICEAEGHVILFDLFLGCIVNVFEERGYHIMHPQFSLIPTECRFTQDGLYFIVSSEYGSVSLYGYDSRVFFALSPAEQFLETDFTGIEIASDSMKALPEGMRFGDDINSYPVGPILTIKGETYQNIVSIRPQELLFALNNPLCPSAHRPQIELQEGFMGKLAYSLREGALLDLSYQKTYEQIESSKQIILFHERERQYSKLVALTSHKIDSLRAHAPSPIETQNMAILEEEEPIVRTRKLKRHTQMERVNYVDDFSYNDSEEEDFNLIEQELPEELEEEDEESSPEEEEPRLRKRERTRIRRQTRQSNPIRFNEPSLAESEERMPTRSRQQAHYREQEEVSESVPKKRGKHEHEEQSEQPKKYSRLRKQAPQEELQQPIDCYRCQLVKATQLCDKCGFTQQYCYECSLMRGRKIKDKFKCIICLFLQNESQEEYEHVNELIYRTTTPNREPFIPQLGDRVRFFFQGYEEFLVQNVDRLNNEVVKKNGEFRILPHTEDLQLLNVPLCTVKSVDYMFPVKGNLTNNFKRNPGKGEPTPILMLVGLAREQSKPLERKEQKMQLLEQQQQLEEREQKEETQQKQEMFWIFFIPGSDFLLPQSIYCQIAEKELVSRFVQNQLILIKEEEMQIVEITPFEDRYPESIWKLIKIRKTEGKRLRGNTKEIERRINIWRASEEITYPQEQRCIEEKHIQRLVSHAESWDNEDSPFRIFIDYVDFEIYPLYRHQVPVGICLRTILERLKNNYYRSYESLKADFDRIYSNSVIFNGETHSVTESALELRNCLYHLLLQEDQLMLLPPPQPQPQPQPLQQSQSKKTQEQSNSKKQRRKRESEEYIDPGYLATERRRTRKQNPPLRSRKRRQSSQYQQSSVSLQQGVGVSTRGGRGRQQEQQNKRMTRSRNKG